MTKETQKTAQAAKQFTRRTALKAATATASVAAMGPWTVRDAFSSSGEINILMWSDYLPERFIADFAKSTGIKINYTGIGSNEDPQ